ncbi:MAG: bifunctional nuclease family protein [Elusimicrobiota bacterium]|nr:bifunctional nuclease family protein [Elusimicrobiota bacterium]
MAKNDKDKDKDKDKEKEKAAPAPAPAAAGAEREVRIYSLATTVNECIIFLEEMGGNRLLPIWIGITEGQAIAIRFSGIVLPRPLTHDLLLAAIKELGWSVKKIVVCDIKENTFYARIHVTDGKKTVALDSRPSDAIAIAVRAGCPIMVEEKVFDRCQTLNKPISEEEVGKFKEDLKNIRPEDIFKDLKKGKPAEGGAPPRPKPQEEEEGEDE